MTAQLDALLRSLGLKAVDRAGWLRHGIAAPESVAAHSWGTSLLVLTLLPPELDRDRALTYAVLHDLPEVIVGDVTPHDGLEHADKLAQERVAMATLAATLPRGADLQAAWTAYEAQSDAEARFVKQLDRLDMALQAVVYAEAGAAGMSEFVDSAAIAVTHEALVPLIEECVARIHAAESRRG